MIVVSLNSEADKSICLCFFPVSVAFFLLVFHFISLHPRPLLFSVRPDGTERWWWCRPFCLTYLFTFLGKSNVLLVLRVCEPRGRSFNIFCSV